MAVVNGYEIGPDADLADANLNSANLNSANLTGANLTGANLSTTILIAANLTGANLTSANLTSANLVGANLVGANLSGANLRIAILAGANLTKADLTSAELANANLFNANLSGANLNNANLNYANLNSANLIAANLIAANLIAANLVLANLVGANLSGANLNNANLNYANLTKADLTGADLRNANLVGVIGYNLGPTEASDTARDTGAVTEGAHPSRGSGESVPFKEPEQSWLPPTTVAQTFGTRTNPFSWSIEWQGFDPFNLVSITAGVSALVQKANQFNKKPLPGQAYVALLVSGTYTGTASIHSGVIAGSLKIAGDKSKVYDPVGVSDMLDVLRLLSDQPNVIQGGSMVGHIFYLVDADDANFVAVFNGPDGPQFAKIGAP